MTTFCWRVADRASRLLDAGERTVVRGDLEEAHATGPRALREILGLVGRRQRLLWTKWRPWVALTLAVPLGLQLAFAARRWSYVTAIYAWLYVDNWTWAYMQSAGSRGDLERFVGAFLVRAIALAVTSWASGFSIGLLSRRAVWAAGAAFLLLVAAFPDAPTADQHAEVFSLMLYRVVLPLLARIVLIAIPAVWGMCVAFRHIAPAERRTLVP